MDQNTVESYKGSLMNSNAQYTRWDINHPLNHVLCLFKGLLRKYVPLIAEGLTR